jgi:hypothetical protein
VSEEVPQELHHVQQDDEGSAASEDPDLGETFKTTGMSI